MNSSRIYRVLSHIRASTALLQAPKIVWALMGLSVLTGLATSEAEAQTCQVLFNASKASEAESVRLLIRDGYQTVEIRKSPSPGVSSQIIEQARKLVLHVDFKILSDLREKPLSAAERKAAVQRSIAAGMKAHAEAKRMAKSESEARLAHRKAQVSSLLADLFESGENELMDAPPAVTRPRVMLEKGTEKAKATLKYIEDMVSKLVRRTPTTSRGSLIPLPFPVVIPGERFQESYYWDTYFSVQGLLRTGRWDLSAMQVENFLFMIENYGLVPNGMRDYYLSRSQPPMLTPMIRSVLEAGLKQGKSRAELEKWVRERALPLLKKDYHEFWMNPKTRYDEKTGLNHHWDEHDTDREERSAHDRDDLLAKTRRDTRAEAESGEDFTDAYGGEATRVGGVLLNSVMYKVEEDMAWLSEFIGERNEGAKYHSAAEKRKSAIDTYLWDPKAKSFFNFHFDKGRIPIVTADIFVPLWAGLASSEQAAGVLKQSAVLMSKGGIMGSNVESGKQWDKPYVWAPQQFFAMAGLKLHGYVNEAQDIAKRWTDMHDNIHAEHGVLLEKGDGLRAAAPIEKGDKYKTQRGFAWTNFVYIWARTEILGAQLVKIPAATESAQQAQ